MLVVSVGGPIERLVAGYNFVLCSILRGFIHCMLDVFFRDKGLML